MDSALPRSRLHLRVDGALLGEVVSRPESWRPRSHAQARRDGVSDADMATIIYTSGTTGKPKGVMLTTEHRPERPQQHSPPARARSWHGLPRPELPAGLPHFRAHAALLVHARGHDRRRKPGDREDDLAAAKPHMFTAVPRLLEKFYDGIVAKGKPPVASRLASSAGPSVSPSNGNQTDRMAGSTNGSSASPASWSLTRSRGTRTHPDHGRRMWIGCAGFTPGPLLQWCRHSCTKGMD